MVARVQNFDFTAFESYNLLPLAVAGIEIDFKPNLIAPYPKQLPNFVTKMEKNVATF